MAKAVAFCNSSKCMPANRDGSQKEGFRSCMKDVSIFETFCPDCGYALWWENKNRIKKGGNLYIHGPTNTHTMD